MPRHRRLNLPSCIYHVITMGLECKNIFKDNYDFHELINHLSLCLKETGCQCLGWALIPYRYLLELLIYVHLNPLRVQLVKDLYHLDRYPWRGHLAIMGYKKREWQEVDELLGRFWEKIGESQKMYIDFIKESIVIGKRDDLLTAMDELQESQLSLLALIFGAQA